MTALPIRNLLTRVGRTSAPLHNLAMDGKLGGAFRTVTSLNSANAFNSMSNQDVAGGVQQFVANYTRLLCGAYGRDSNLVVRTDEGDPGIIKSSVGRIDGGGDEEGDKDVEELENLAPGAFDFMIKRITVKAPQCWRTTYLHILGIE